MADETPVVAKSTSVQVPNAGFPDEVMKAVQKGLTAQPQRSLAFQNRANRSTAFLQKGLTKPGKISYEVLRRTALSVHIVRICIQTLKQRTTKTKWAVQYKDISKRKKGDTDSRIEEITRFFSQPNPNDTFRTLLDKMLEDLLSLDAVSLEKTRYPDGTLAEIFYVDSATVRPVYDDKGNMDVVIPLRTKEAAEQNKVAEELPVSYVQVMENSQYGGPESGEIVAAWPKKDFIHFHMNPQGAMDAFGYGLSPIESILSVVANLLNADNYNSTYFEEGAFPPIVLQLIGQVNQRDLEAYREYLQAELSGNFHRPAIMATEKAESLQIHNLKDISNRDMQFMEYQLWLAKLCCAAYGLSPEDIGLTDTTGSKSVSEVQKDLSDSKGYASILDLLSEVINQEIVWKDFGYDDLEFSWVATDNIEPDIMSQIYDRDLKNGTRTLNEVRALMGEAPYPEWADEPMFFATDGYKPVDPSEAKKLAEEAMEGQEGEEKPYKEQDGKDIEGADLKKMRKAVMTPSGFRIWADDRGYSQPFIWMDVKNGFGQVIKPPVAVNLASSYELEIHLTNELSAKGLNVKPVRKMSFVEVCEMLRSNPDLYNEFINYTNMAEAYDSEKWRSKFGGSRKFNFYLVSDYIDGWALSNPLLIADMKRDPNSYKQAVRDLAELWKMEKEMVLGDRRTDQYIITHDKRAFGFDYQFMSDEGRWEKSKTAIEDTLADIPQLLKEFKEAKKDGVVKAIIKRLRR